MIDRIIHLIAVGWRSAFEIVLLTVVTYYGYLYFRGTRGAKVLTGLAIVFLALTLISTLLKLAVIGWIIRSTEVNATVGNSRWWIEPLCPEILPRKDLRDTPTTSGRSWTRWRGRFFNNERLCASVFPNPIPGSNASVIGSTPNFRAQAYCCRKKSATSATTSR